MPHNPTPLDVAWAAGLFEGEGTVGVYARKNAAKLTLIMTLGMTDPDVVERFAAVVGCGTMYKRQDPRHNHKEVTIWRIGGVEDVRATIGLLLPYLGKRRRARALEVLAACDSVQTANGKKTHCPEGHLLSGDNLIEEPIKRLLASGEVGEYTARRCRKCRAEKSRKRSRDYQRRIRNSPPERWRKE